MIKNLLATIWQVFVSLLGIFCLVMAIPTLGFSLLAWIMLIVAVEFLKAKS